MKEWVKSGGPYKKPLNVYANPGSSDYIEMIKDAKKRKDVFDEIRFVVDPRPGNQKVYVADAQVANHADICDIIGLPYGEFVLPPLAQGKALVTGGKAKVIPNGKGFDNKAFGYATKKREDYLKYNWSFVDRYISGFSQEMDKFFKKS